MSVPKRRHTSSRTNKRRLHDALDTKIYTSCSKCGKPVMPHHACEACGTYDGKKVLTTSLDKKTAKTAKSKTATK
ncbi:MAG: 50S ribosomal protein L32 [Patescibacteria group bacterium]